MTRASPPSGVRQAPSAGRPRSLPYGRLVTLTAFAIAMGHLEAVVVVYIREILGMVPTPENLTRAVVEEIPGWVLAVEQTREAATIIMLVALALLAGRNAWERLGAFLLAFGIWDITYYVSLKAMIDWPKSLATMDLLFMIPNHWYAPVWVPLVASCGLIVLGIFCFRAARRQVRR